MTVGWALLAGFVAGFVTAHVWLKTMVAELKIMLAELRALRSEEEYEEDYAEKTL